MVAASEGGDFYGYRADESAYPGGLDELLASKAGLLEAGKKLIKNAPALDLAQVEFLPPLQRPGKIICLGLNYKSHSEEFGFKKADYPEFFTRFPTTLVGHNSPMIKPMDSDQFDYEGELAAVIGGEGRRIPKDEALDYIAAYSIFNDGSVRNYQFRGSQWLPGKNFDASGGFGPWLITADSLPAGAKGLHLETRLNGQVLQSADTGDMIFDLAEQISLASQFTTLKPGDMFITGTPGGVGQARTPQVFMKPGDVCEVEIEKIGVLRNHVIEEG